MRSSGSAGPKCSKTWDPSLVLFWAIKKHVWLVRIWWYKLILVPQCTSAHLSLFSLCCYRTEKFIISKKQGFIVIFLVQQNFNIAAKRLSICMEMLYKSSAKTSQNCCVLWTLDTFFGWLTVTYQGIVDSQNCRTPDRSKWWAGLSPSCCRLCAADVWPHSFIMPLWKAGQACLQLLYNYQGKGKNSH